MPNITNVETFNAVFDNKGHAHKFAWPGGYPIYYLMSDGESMCADCVTREAQCIANAIKENSSDGWRVVGNEINWEDNALFCGHCGKRIESAYAEDETEEDSE